jgi:hypothetical protein
MYTMLLTVYNSLVQNWHRRNPTMAMGQYSRRLGVRFTSTVPQQFLSSTPSMLVQFWIAGNGTVPRESPAGTAKSPAKSPREGRF